MPKREGSVFDRRLETIGFDEKQIRKYIYKYFPNDETGTTDAINLLKFLHKNPGIRNAMRNPMLLALVCSAWETNIHTRKLPYNKINITHLYQTIINRFLEKFLFDKKDKTLHCYDDTSIFREESCQHEMDFLQQLAFISLHANMKKFCVDQISQEREAIDSTLLNMDIFDTALKIGLLEFDNINKEHYFSDPKLQEFLAARYLKDCLMKNQEDDLFKNAVKFIETNRYIPRFRYLFAFLSGLVSDEKSTDKPLLHFWNAILSNPLDITGLGHTCLIIPCLEEANCDERIPKLSDSIKSIQRSVGMSFNTATDKDACLVNVPKKIAEEILPLLAASPSVFAKANILPTYLERVRSLNSRCEAKQALEILNSCGLLENSGTDVVTPTTFSTGLLLKLHPSKSQLSSIVTEIINFHKATKQPIDDMLLQIPKKMISEQVVQFALDNLMSKDPNPSLTGLLLELPIACIVKQKIMDMLIDALKNKHQQLVAAAVLIQLYDAKINKLCAPIFEDPQKCLTLNSSILKRIISKISTPKVIQAMLDILESPQGKKNEAAMVLSHMGFVASNKKNVIDILIKHLNDVEYAAQAIGNLVKFTNSGPYLKQILSILETGTPIQQKNAARALAFFDEKAGNSIVIHALCDAFNKNSNIEIIKTINVLIKFIPHREDDIVIKTLMIALKNKDCKCSEEAAKGLGLLGRSAAHEDVVTALIESYSRKASSFSHYTKSYRQTVARTLGQLQTKSTKHQIINALSQTRLKDTRTCWMGVIDAFNTMHYSLKPLITAKIKAVENFWPDSDLKYAFKNLLIDPALLIEIYKKTSHSFLPELIILNALTQAITISLNQNGLVLHNGKKPQLFALSPEQLKLFKDKLAHLGQKYGLNQSDPSEEKTTNTGSHFWAHSFFPPCMARAKSPPTEPVTSSPKLQGFERKY